MKYIFRGNVVFEYVLESKQVIQHWNGSIPMFNYCSWIPEDYKLLGVFFDTVHRHIQGEEVELKDIVVN
jgi:hypothetical protein